MKIKIIWDFRGEFSEKTAAHHAIHLKEFCEKHSIETDEIGVDTKSEFYHLAFIITSKENIAIIRDVLKPHRAEVVDKM
jgi:hypothetical protein